MLHNIIDIYNPDTIQAVDLRAHKTESVTESHKVNSTPKEFKSSKNTKQESDQEAGKKTKKRGKKGKLGKQHDESQEKIGKSIEDKPKIEHESVQKEVCDKELTHDQTACSDISISVENMDYNSPHNSRKDSFHASTSLLQEEVSRKFSLFQYISK